MVRASLKAVRGGAGLLVAACLAVSVLATAAGAGDDKATAEAALREVDSSPKKDVASEPAARARAALERSTRMRSAGDEAHARLADSLARAWAEVARDVARAATVEARSSEAHLGAADAGVTADRERALLEEAIAQSGRLRAQLEAAERGTKEAPTRTSAAAKESGDAGAGKPRAPKPVSSNAGGGAIGPSGRDSMKKPGPNLDGGAP